jgi:hypothetical protein
MPICCNSARKTFARSSAVPQPRRSTKSGGTAPSPSCGITWRIVHAKAVAARSGGDSSSTSSDRATSRSRKQHSKWGASRRV